jgi:hypothetical protein
MADRSLFAKFMVKADVGGVKRQRAEADAGVVIEAMERLFPHRKPCLNTRFIAR